MSYTPAPPGTIRAIAGPMTPRLLHEEMFASEKHAALPQGPLRPMACAYVFRFRRSLLLMRSRR